MYPAIYHLDAEWFVGNEVEIAPEYQLKLELPMSSLPLATSVIDLKIYTGMVADA